MLKKLLLTLVLLGMLGLGVVGYLWIQATALPDWYADERDPMEPPDSAGPHAVEPSAPPSRLEWADADDGSVPLGSAGDDPGAASSKSKGRRGRKREMRGFHLRSTAKNTSVRRAIRGSRASYENGQLEAGVVIDLGKVSPDALAAKDRATYDRAMAAFPALGKRRVYVGLEDEPVFDGGIMQLGPDTKVRVGKLSYSLAGVARRLGVSEAELRRQINAEFRRLKVVDPDLDRPAQR